MKRAASRAITIAGGLITSAAVLAALLVVFGDTARSLFGMSADALAGESRVASHRASKADALERKKMVNFAEGDVDDGPAPSSPLGNSHQAVAANSTVETRADHLSTFAIDVDTASYALSRRTINQGSLPVPAGVRVEEWVNAFKYELPAPRQEPFAVSVEGAPSPYREGRTLLKVSLQGKKVANAERKPAHLVFLVDESCSMSSSDRLPLAQESLRILTGSLNDRDTVAIATYASAPRVVLEPTSARDKRTILAAIDSLRIGGGTAMGTGMELAYRMAVRQVSSGSITRVLVLTDGDANIGPNQSADQMLKSLKAYVDEGVTLTTVGFGMGNYRDNTLERLADKGNGQSLYIDSRAEAERVFVRDVAGTLEHIARDVKVQVDFDPQAVRSYRLLGYENRAVRDEDFRNDAVDGGELGAGHSVTALYEVELTGEPKDLGVVRVRGQRLEGGGAFEVAERITPSHFARTLAEASTELRFATAVALAADELRGNPSAADWPLGRVMELAQAATRENPDREEFVQLLRRVIELKARSTTVSVRPPFDGY